MEFVLSALADALTITTLTYLTIGLTIGVIIGALPGLNAPIAIAVAVPMTYSFDALTAIGFLLGINKGASFGGSIAAILLNTPGTPDSAATALDGHPLARQGKGEKAMKIALYSSVTGETIADIVLILVAAPLSVVALMMGPAEITAVLLFAFTFVAGLTGRSVLKGLIALSLGILLSTIGYDPVTAEPRLTFGSLELADGLPLVAVSIGLLALSEVLLAMERIVFRPPQTESVLPINDGASDRRISFAEFRSCLPTIIRSGMFGTAIGALPGLGATLASFFAYGYHKRRAKDPSEWGKGAIEGIAAPEAANSAVVGGSLIPLLTLGIPGNVASALLIGAFLIHGVTPGPLIFEHNAKLVYGIFAALAMANLINLVVGMFGLRLFALVVRVPGSIIYPAVTLLCLTGAYIDRSNFFDVWLALGFAVLGYFMKKLDFSFVAFLVGFVLTPTFEANFRSAALMGQNAPLKYLMAHPVAIMILILTIFIFIRLAWQPKAKA